jgi:hypothetical protein
MAAAGAGHDVKEEWQNMSLWAELERVHRRLQVGDEGMEIVGELGDAVEAARPLPAAFAEVAERAVPVASLTEAFGLSAFERDLLLLCAGAALDPRFADSLSALQSNPSPTFGLAAARLEAPHWSALSPLRPLRYWRLVEIGAGPIYQAPLTIDPRVLQALRASSRARRRSLAPLRARPRAADGREIR